MGYGLPEWLGETPLPEWVTPEQALRLQDRREAVLVDCRDPTGMGNGPGHADGCPEGAVNLSATATIMVPRPTDESIVRLGCPQVACLHCDRTC